MSPDAKKPSAKSQTVSENEQAAARKDARAAAATATGRPAQSGIQSPVSGKGGGVGEGGRSGEGVTPIPVLDASESQQEVMLEPGAEVVLAGVKPKDAATIGVGPGGTATASDTVEGIDGGAAKGPFGIFARRPGGLEYVGYADSEDKANADVQQRLNNPNAMRDDFVVQPLGKKLGKFITMALVVKRQALSPDEEFARGLDAARLLVRTLLDSPDRGVQLVSARIISDAVARIDVEIMRQKQREWDAINRPRKTKAR